MNLRQVFIMRADDREPCISRLVTALRGLEHNDAWRIEVTEYKDTRSLEQNAYLWGVVYPTILEHSDLAGWDADDLHTYFLGEHFGWQTITAFGRTRVKPVKRSSRLSISQFGEYVDFVIRKAAELGIVIPEAKL
jgi:hypothetical protein